MIRIVIAEDHALVREGIKKIISSTEGICVVAEAMDFSETLRLIEMHHPDVVTLDLGLAAAGADNGLEAVELLRERFPELPVLVLSMHPEERYAIRALKAGAAGYVTKAMAAEEVIKGIRKIAAGGRYISPQLAELLALDILEPHKTIRHEWLTDRELQVMRMLGAGMQAKQIAATLSISVSSVNTYRGRIFRKMSINSNAALIRYVIEHGLS